MLFDRIMFFQKGEFIGLVEYCQWIILTMPEPLLGFVRQSIASSNVQGAIEHVVGLLVAKATILVL
jgi:hypothetical protein